MPRSGLKRYPSNLCRWRKRIAFDRSRPTRRDDRLRINERIRVREIRVIDDAGQQLGIMPPPQALILARQKGLDLVEISPTAVPPVCRIMDYGKYQYQEQKRAREAKRHQKVIEVKEIKFRPKVDEHDYQFKKHHIERFIEDGDKVKATIFFRGREMAHPEIGHRILMRLIKDLEEVAMAETMPRQEGNQMHTILTGKKGAPKAEGRRPKRPKRQSKSKQKAEAKDRVMAKKQKLKTHTRRGQAVQEDRHRQVHARLGVQAPHPHEQVDQESSVTRAATRWSRRVMRARSS